MATASVSSNASPFGQDIAIRQFHLVSDEPVEEGGEDAGPKPCELLLASLGSCKAITLKMYAQRKGWPLESVDVALRDEKVDNEHRIHATLTLTGDLDDEQRKRLLTISDRCPIQRLLTGEVQVQTRLIMTDEGQSHPFKAESQTREHLSLT